MAGYLGIEANDKKPFVFISYNTEDQRRLSNIVQLFHQYGISIWYDKGLKVVSEEEWQEQIAIHIREAELLFFFISKGIFSKSDSFVRKEYDLAARHNKNVCAVLLEQIDNGLVPAKYDFWWGEIQNKQCIVASDISDDALAKKMFEECSKIEVFRDIEEKHSKFLALVNETGSVAILNQGINLIGRIKGRCDIFVQDYAASKKHAEIRLINNTAFLTDLHTVNGTWINGSRIAPKIEHALQTGDVIKIGKTDFRLVEIEPERTE